MNQIPKEVRSPFFPIVQNDKNFLTEQMNGSISSQELLNNSLKNFPNTTCSNNHFGNNFEIPMVRSFDIPIMNYNLKVLVCF